MKNKVVYTCITGGYDQVQKHEYVNPKWDYILFTDDKKLIKQGSIYHWQVRKNIFNKRDNSRNSRYEKINPHAVLASYEYSLYIDASYIVKNINVFEIIDRLIKDNILIAIPPHYERNCIYDEAEIIKEYRIDYTKLVDKQMAILRKNNYPEQNGLFENCMIFRRHNDLKLIEAEKLWWQMVLDYSRRDQLSAVYAFWKNNIKIEALFEEKGYNRNSDDFDSVFGEKHARAPVIIPFTKRSAQILTCWIPIKKVRHKLREKLRAVKVYKYK